MAVSGSGPDRRDLLSLSLRVSRAGLGLPPGADARARAAGQAALRLGRQTGIAY